MKQPVVVSGNANVPLAQAVAERLGAPLNEVVLQRFPDGELHAEVRAEVRGHDVYVIQPTSPPVDQHLMELLFLGDACRRAGAARLTAVVPYFGYARQDRRTRGQEAIGARLVADLIQASGYRQLVAVDLHSPTIEGFFSIPVEHLTAVPLLADAARPFTDHATVVLAPDMGAVRLAERYASLLGLPWAMVHKVRLSGSEVSVQGVVGDVRDRSILLVDDMISTAGTVEAAVKAGLAAGARPDVTLAVTHMLLVGPAVERLQTLPVRCLVATDSTGTYPAPPVPLESVSLGALLAETIMRLGESL